MLMVHIQLFYISSGVKQGDVISRTLFAIFINDLCQGMNELNLEVKIHDQLIESSLLFAEEHLQRMLDFISHWCSQNKMSVSISKTKVVHFRKKNNALTDFEFNLGDSILEICHKYKYLGVILNEFLDLTETANVLSESAGRAFSMLVSNLYKKVDVTWSTYSKMYKK